MEIETMHVCKFCGKSESKDVLICSDCVQKLLFLDKDQVQALHHKCIERGQVEKANLIEKLLNEENDYVPEAREVRPGMVGKRFMRSTQSTNDKVRA